MPNFLKSNTTYYLTDSPMASLQNLNFETQIPSDFLIARIMDIHFSISKLESLRPSKQVNILFSHLVKLCTLPSSIDIKALPQEVQQMRKNLIILCGRAECLLELEFAKYLSKIPQPLKNLNLFPYYENYVKLAKMEYGALIENGLVQLKKVAFVGSGSMPLTSIIMASEHMKSTHFDNFDMDEAANDVARKIVSSDAQIQKRMKFLTSDIMEVKEQLAEYDCIFLAALVGRSEEEKGKILRHIRKYMKDGGALLVRSAKGARAFLYHVVEENDLLDFEVLYIFHPTDDMINSIVLLHKSIFESKEEHEKMSPSMIDELWTKPPKLVVGDKEQLSITQLQDNRLENQSHLLLGDLVQQASLSNSSPFEADLLSFKARQTTKRLQQKGEVQVLDAGASKRAKIIEEEKKASAETALPELPSSSQRPTIAEIDASKTNKRVSQSARLLCQIESSSSGLTFSNIRSKKQANSEHLVPLIQKAEKVIPKSHAAKAERISLSTTWDIALANLLRVGFLLELHRPLAMKSFDAFTQMGQRLEAAKKQVTELSEKIMSEQRKNRELRSCILQLSQSLLTEEKRRFEAESELETLKQKFSELEDANNNAVEDFRQSLELEEM